MPFSTYLWLAAAAGLVAVWIFAGALAAGLAAAAAALMILAISLEPLMLTPAVLLGAPAAAYGIDGKQAALAVGCYAVWALVLLVVWELRRVQRMRNWRRL